MSNLKNLFSDQDLSKKLYDLGCETHSTIWHYKMEKGHLVRYAPHYRIDDFVLENEHCLRNWKKIIRISKELQKFASESTIENGFKKEVRGHRHEMIDSEDHWSYLENILE